jgi:spermidine synthase
MVFDYYNEEVHQAAFALPNFMKKRLGQWLKD